MRKISIVILILTMVGLLFTGCSSGGNDQKKEDKKADTQKTQTVKAEEPLKVSDAIHIDQIGYRPKDQKIVVTNGIAGPVEIVDESNNTVVFKGEAQGGEKDASSGDTIYTADFSSVEKPGKYHVNIPGKGVSYPFTIGEDVYASLKDGLLKGLYYQRCGTALDEKQAGQWIHDACHLQDGVLFGATDKKLEVKGGWHDAGDYGRYSAPGAVAAADLLLAYEFFPKAFEKDINIPESGNKVPDILDEARYELEWLLKMQDKASGGVYHKLTSAGFPDIDVMPEVDVADLIVLPVSGTATGDFAALMAEASRIYKPFDEAFSQKCIAASEKAWKWLMKNPNAPGFKNPSSVSTGEYGDPNDSDERYWAAAELYRTTGKKEYHDYFRKAYDALSSGGTKSLDGFSHSQVSGFGTISYLYSGQDKVDTNIYNTLKSNFLKRADDLAAISKKDGYGISLTTEDYIWGSNMVVMNDALHLILANQIQSNGDYVQAAENHLHYLMGRNALSQSFVTGFGAKPILQPHHRPSVGDGVKEAVPGLVSGGPDSRLEDNYANTNLQGLPPARCFGDDLTSYSTNEIAIYWNTPAVFVAGYFDQK